MNNKPVTILIEPMFVKMREVLSQNRELAQKLAELERRLTERLEVHKNTIVHILDEIKKLMEPLPPVTEPKRRETGFHVRDERQGPIARKADVRAQ